MVVLVADAAQNAMASEHHSLTEGAVLVATIFAWNYGWRLAYCIRVNRSLNPPPLLLIENGRLQGRNLRAEMLTKADLAEQLREQGIEDFAEVRRCYLEGTGRAKFGAQRTKSRPLQNGVRWANRRSANLSGGPTAMGAGMLRLAQGRCSLYNLRQAYGLTETR